MDKLSNIKHMLHMLKYDKEYSDLSGYVADIEYLITQNTSLVGALKTANDAYYELAAEHREFKKQYAETAQKMKRLTENRKKYIHTMQQIKTLASGGEVRG